jgi:hypothetical protein
MVSGPPYNANFCDPEPVTFANLEQHDRFRRVCPDWRKEDISSAGHKWLSNDIHPAFAEARFCTEGFNHEETLLARRLASRLLEAECVVPFWWTLIFEGDGRAADDESLAEEEAMATNVPIFTDEECQNFVAKDVVEILGKVDAARIPGHVMLLLEPPRFSEDASPEELTPDQIEKTKAVLRDLGRAVHYHAFQRRNSTSMHCETAWFKRFADLPFRGSPSVICISPQALSMHSTAMKGDLINQAYASVFLGMQFVQQFAHFLVAATRSGPHCNWSSNYKFIATDKVGADDRMLESCTFGGVFRKEQELDSKTHYTIDGLEGVPGLWFAYSDHASATSLQTVGKGKRPEQEKGNWYHREWQVRFSWLLEVLTDDFWDVKVATRGQSAMEPPKEVGYVMAQGIDGRKYGPLHSKEIRDEIVPDGWGMLPRSYLVVIHELHHDAAGAIMFGNFGAGRMAHHAFEDVEGEDSDGSPVTKATSVSQAPDEDDEDEEDEDEEDEDEADDEASAEDASMEDVWEGEDDGDVLMEDFSDD